MSIQELQPDRLCRRCDPAELAFETTADLEDLEGLLGQPRALAAVELGIGMRREGYNIFAHGPDGTGKHSAIRRLLEEHARSAERPPDLCYVYNFQQPRQPRLLRLPAGRGRALRSAMQHLAEELVGALQAALDTEEYQTRRQLLEDELEERQAAALAELGKEAGEAGLAVVRTPVGFVFAPRKGDEVLSPEQFQRLSEDERQRLEGEIERFKERTQKLLHQFRRWKREARDGTRKLNLEVSRFAIAPLIEEVREEFADLPEVLAHLDAAEADILDNAHRLGAPPDGSLQELLGSLGGDGRSERAELQRYQVNLLVDHDERQGAPIVYEDNPTYANLVGRVEHLPRMGNLVTDFTLIKAGALHRANGGYLVLDFLRLLRQPYAWDGLKRALRARQIRIESIGEALSLISTYSLEPQPAPLELKVVLIGEPYLYYLLYALDPEFGELFKIAADFAPELDWDRDNLALYARLVATLARDKELRPLEREAVARLVEEGARALGDGRKMSLLMGRVLDLMREADHQAGRAGRETISAGDVEKALEDRIFRSDRLRERVQEMIRRQIVLLDTSGAKVGQVNGLSVLQLGDFSFGRPSRITARVRLGKGEVVDIEREVELSGPLHSKGVLILTGFLGERYAAERPLSLSASLVFEQSYGGIEGDSASSAELYALLSAISGVPIRQSLAVTGSVNQRGEIQAIGGVNEKIEGFFDVCAGRGLSGEQGVLIPAANVEHLMLRRKVIEAVTAGEFHIYAVETVDHGIELLTGLPAGEPDDSGAYPAGSVNQLVARRLTQLARQAQRFAQPAAAPSGAAAPES